LRCRDKERNRGTDETWLLGEVTDADVTFFGQRGTSEKKDAADDKAPSDSLLATMLGG